MKNLTRILIVSLVTLTTALPEISLAQTRKADNADLDELVAPEKLPEIIGRPKQEKITVSRDPFAPLIKTQPPAEVAKAAEEERRMDVFKGMEYAGVIKWGERYSAYIRTDSGKEVYQINDRVGDWTITDISEQIITFKNGDNTYQLQRGDK